MKKLLWFYAVIVIVAVLTLTACGDAEDEVTADTDSGGYALVTPTPSPSPNLSPTPVPAIAPAPSPMPTPQPMPPLSEIVAPIGTTIALGSSEWYAICADGNLWRYVWAGEIRHIIDYAVHVFSDIFGQVNVKRTDGSLWGYRRGEFVHILDDVVYASRNFAITSDDALWTWGCQPMMSSRDERGMSEYLDAPQRILDDVQAISVGADHIMAIRKDGSLYGWGGNFHGQVGNGTRGEPFEPVKIPVRIMDDVIAVSAGGFHTAAITSDGALWTWGNNSTGQVGDNTYTIIGMYWEVIEDNSRLYPKQILGGVAAVLASSMPEYGVSGDTLVIRDDGSVWGWGFGRNVGSVPYHRNTWGWFCPHPGQILDISNAAQLLHDAVLTDDGELWTFRFGEITLILDDVVSAATSSFSNVALRADGSLWHWANISPSEHTQPEQVFDGALMCRNK